METVPQLEELAQEEVSQTLQIEAFGNIDLADPFFDSLKQDYGKFAEWFNRKSDSEAFVFRIHGNQTLDGFLYLKQEDGVVADVDPPLAAAKRLKMGTFKINPHSTRLGERFIVGAD